MGTEDAEIIGLPVAVLIPGDRQGEESMILEKIHRGERVHHFETVRRRRAGSLIDVSLTISPIRDQEGTIVGASKIMRDITERRKADEKRQALNAELQRQISERNAQLKDREAMLKEIHHRVKNNLQVISSLVNMQARAVSDTTTRSVLQQCRARVDTMAHIHEMLYVSSDYSRIPFGTYVNDLVTRIIYSCGGAVARVTVKFSLAEPRLPLDLAVPCGLILNELVSNALKHAFPNESSGELRVSLEELEGRRILMSVSDNGVGFDSERGSASAGSLGLRLVHTLAKQLDARIELTCNPGTTCTIDFPAE